MARLHAIQAANFDLEDLKSTKSNFGLKDENIFDAWDHLDGIKEVWGIAEFLDRMSYFDEQVLGMLTLSFMF